MEKAVVTGANGFVGTALCKTLSENGVNVIAVVRKRGADVEGIKNLNGLSIVYCDLSEFKNLASAIGDRDIDVLYHLAWAGTSGPLRGNVDVQIKNVQYACDVVKACAEMGCRKIVFASSIMEYEIKALMETDETPGANTLYCSAKVSADYMARTVAGASGIEYIRAVISNT